MDRHEENHRLFDNNSLIMSGLGFWAADSSDESDDGSVGQVEDKPQVPTARTTGRFEVADSSSGTTSGVLCLCTWGISREQVHMNHIRTNNHPLSSNIIQFIHFL